MSMLRLFGALCAGLVACSSDQAGTSTETTNGIAGVVTVENVPLGAARVALVYNDGALSPYSTTTDSLGYFEFQADSGHYNLWVDSKDSSSSAWLYDVLVGRDTALQVGLQATGAWFIEGFDPLDSVCLLSTPFCQTADPLGTVFFNRLPYGAFTAMEKGKPVASATIHPGDTVVTKGFSRSFVLEDFEDGDSRHLLAPWSGGKGWYIGVAPNTRLDFPTQTPLFPSALVYDNAREGRSLLVRYTDTAPKPQVVSMQVGLFLGEKGLDWTGLDSLCFWARGSGMVRVALEQEKGNGEYTKAIWDIKLEDDWRQFSLVTSATVWGEGYPMHVPFQEIASQVHRLTFLLTEGREFALDHIWVTGLSAHSFHSW